MQSATNESFESALERFLTTTQAFVNDVMAEIHPGVKAPTLECIHGTRYVKVARVENGGRSAYCFIDKTTGDVLKAAGWKAPARTPRGSVYAPDFSGYGVGLYGARYL